MLDERPNPDALLAQVQAAEAEARRGTLKVFFGYAAGVGKTYAMLENAHRAQAAGREVLVGYVEPHGRPETEALLAGLEILPAREYEYRGMKLREFDVDAALQRRPELLLVDELAHTNAQGCRHEKRWQDVEELLEAGINVWTTLNVQHIESLNDVIGQITGVVVRETIPDRVFDLADDLELVDITPEELLTRLKAGKVYVPEQAQRALESFFQKANLTALRELSLRQAARRVHTDVESARREKSDLQPWATAERLLVCVGPSPTTARVIRTAKRMAAALDAPWIAVNVDLTGEPAESLRNQRIAQHFRLAERLGAETITLAGQDVAGTILNYARSRNVTKILIGKTSLSRWRRLLFGTAVDNIIDRCGAIDVYVIHGVERDRKEFRPTRPPASSTEKLPYLKAAVAVAGAGAIAHSLRWLDLANTEANTAMIFLTAVVWAAIRYGRGPAMLASTLAVLLFDVLFVPPFDSLVAWDARYVVTLLVMLVIGVVISSLTARLRGQIDSARQRERRTTALYELGKQLSSLYGNVFLAGAAGAKISELLGGEVAIYLRPAAGPAELVYGHDTSIAQHAVSLPAAQWVLSHDQMAGAGTNTLPNAVALFLPLIGTQQTHGALAIRVPDAPRLLAPETRRLLEACANQLALALERDQLAIDAANARIEAEAERVRSNLLSSVSQDLKTPLATIAGASNNLLQSNSLDEATRQQLLQTVADEAARLNRLLEKILQMSKLASGTAAPSKGWHALDQILDAAVRRTQPELAGRPVKVLLPEHLPAIHVDGLLIEQVFANLLENVARHTPPTTEVTVRAAVDGRQLRIAVADDGPGLTTGSETHGETHGIDQFYHSPPGGRGNGLGLSICRAIIKSHGGSIAASNRQGGGAEFIVRLPLTAEAGSPVPTSVRP